MVPDAGEVRPCPLRAGSASLHTWQRDPCTPAVPIPRRHGPRSCRVRARRRLALMPSTGAARGWQDAPAAARPSRQLSPSCPRPQAGRIQPTCCCAGITTGPPSTHLISRVPRSWTLPAGRSRATCGRLAAHEPQDMRDAGRGCGAPPSSRSRPACRSSRGGRAGGGRARPGARGAGSRGGAGLAAARAEASAAMNAAQARASQRRAATSATSQADHLAAIAMDLPHAVPSPGGRRRAPQAAGADRHERGVGRGVQPELWGGSGCAARPAARPGRHGRTACRSPGRGSPSARSRDRHCRHGIVQLLRPDDRGIWLHRSPPPDHRRRC